MSWGRGCAPVYMCFGGTEISHVAKEFKISHQKAYEYLNRNVAALSA